ncbi:MAG: class I SAM-dependent methyltransferase [Archangium sp.]|nr:class I SAM-dependent methyltransferase [Archangium sp.]
MNASQPSARPLTSKELTDIPVGHYHRVMESGHPVRRAWHLLKFTRVLDLCMEAPGAILDIGCFAGSLLSRASEAQYPRQLGVDILPEQLAFANESFGTPFRRFEHIDGLRSLRRLEPGFDYATCVEVIEHLAPAEIRTLFVEVARLLTPGRGRFVLSTPNYSSTWPLLELLLNRVSDVDYSEQHITRFTYFGLERKLREIVPEIDKYFRFEVKTTTHFVSPFLAVLGVDVATKVGSWVPHSRWGSPLGNLVLVRLARNDRPFDEA